MISQRAWEKFGTKAFYWSIGITFKESGVNFRGHIKSYEDGIRRRTMRKVIWIWISYYNLSLPSICLFGIYSLDFQRMLTISHMDNLWGSEGDVVKMELKNSRILLTQWTRLISIPWFMCKCPSGDKGCKCLFHNVLWNCPKWKDEQSAF